MRIVGDRIANFLCIFILATILLLSMPRQNYYGDSLAIVQSSINLVENKSFFFSKDIKSEISDLLIHDDQYFHFNSDKKTYAQRWGWFNTLLFLPPILAASYVESPVKMHSPSVILIRNIYNIILSIVIFFLVFEILEMFHISHFGRWGFIFCVFFCSYCFNYLRAQSYEIFQLLFFLSFLKHFLSFRISSSEKSFYFSLVSLWCLILCKDFYFVLMPFLFFNYALNSFSKKELTYRAFITFIPILMIVFIANKWQFGDYVFQSRFGKLSFESDITAFSVKYVFSRISDYFFSLRFNIFIYFPFLIYSIFSMKIFFRKFRKESMLLFGIVGTIWFSLCFFYGVGQWCYGPRFLFPLVPILALPFISHFDDYLKKRRFIPLLVFFFLSLGLFFIQIEFNSRGFFLHDELESRMKLNKVQGLDDYFSRPSFLVAYDFNNYIATKNDSYPLIVKIIESEQLKEADLPKFKRQLYWYFKNTYKCNYLLSVLCPAE